MVPLTLQLTLDPWTKLHYCVVFCCMYDFLLPLCGEIKITKNASPAGDFDYNRSVNVRSCNFSSPVCVWAFINFCPDIQIGLGLV